jgi:hypothetical protein
MNVSQSHAELHTILHANFSATVGDVCVVDESELFRAGKRQKASALLVFSWNKRVEAALAGSSLHLWRTRHEAKKF